MKGLLVFALAAWVLFSGCIGEESVQNPGIPDASRDTGVRLANSTGFANAAASINATYPAVTAKPEAKYDRFVSWLKTDATDKHPYVKDDSKVYAEQYLCSQFTRDFIRNGTSAGYEIYAAGLTGAARGQDDWHMIAAVVLDNDWYFVDPQTDVILKKESMFYAYGYEYAYFGKEVSISRNDAEISNPVNYHPVIGLNGQNFLYLK